MPVLEGVFHMGRSASGLFSEWGPSVETTLSLAIPRLGGGLSGRRVDRHGEI